LERVRVRFAPSPTGFVHVGSLRTALYNYLFARHHGGDFVLRIEDTDKARFTSGAVEDLLETLHWSRLDYDEGPDKAGEFGPYFQSKRLMLYKKYVDILIKDQKAYPCFCSEERLEKLRKEQKVKKLTPKYDGNCRNLEPDEVKKRSKEKFVIRLKVPANGETIVPDLIRSEVVFRHDMIDDQILLKSDGFPTYHLANVVDDHLMKISHVIRGEEWLISTPKHLLLYQFFGWKPPQFAHLPLLLNSDRSKLSKRQGDVAVEDYREKGYLPEALLNFVALLGWNRGDDQEIFSMNELIKDFSLDRVNKSGAVFDLNKLNWMNGLYLRQLPESDYVSLVLQAMKKYGVDSGDRKTNELIALAVRNNLENFKDIVKQTEMFIKEGHLKYSEEALAWVKSESSREVLDYIKKEIESVSEISLDIFKKIMSNVQKETGIKGKDLWMPVRSALTGLTEGPELPQVIQILGKKKILDFLNQALTT
jgi:glutamyl-tRNA synthetase